ncbi:MAG: hypothetical protein ACXV9T_07405 [Methylobacter sp.]
MAVGGIIGQMMSSLIGKDRITRLWWIFLHYHPRFISQAFSLFQPAKDLSQRLDSLGSAYAIKQKTCEQKTA